MLAMLGVTFATFLVFIQMDLYIGTSELICNSSFQCVLTENSNLHAYEVFATQQMTIISITRVAYNSHGLKGWPHRFENTGFKTEFGGPR